VAEFLHGNIGNVHGRVVELIVEQGAGHSQRAHHVDPRGLERRPKRLTIVVGRTQRAHLPMTNEMCVRARRTARSSLLADRRARDKACKTSTPTVMTNQTTCRLTCPHCNSLNRSTSRQSLVGLVRHSAITFVNDDATTVTIDDRVTVIRTKQSIVLPWRSSCRRRRRVTCR
jgi:hypothetical protein